MVESPTRKISGAVRSELQPRLVSRAKCRVTDPGANPDEKTDEARTPLGKSWPAPETVSTGSGKRNHVQRRLAVKPGVGHERSAQIVSLGLASITEGRTAPNQSRETLSVLCHRFVTTRPIFAGSGRKKGGCLVFGRSQGPILIFSTLPGASASLTGLCLERPALFWCLWVQGDVLQSFPFAQNS